MMKRKCGSPPTKQEQRQGTSARKRAQRPKPSGVVFDGAHAVESDEAVDGAVDALPCIKLLSEARSKNGLDQARIDEVVEGLAQTVLCKAGLLKKH